jgi:two-component sensor histidine kinase
VAAPLMNDTRAPNHRVNILLVDDQPAKLLSYEVILKDLDENLLKASSATEAFQLLLKNDVAVILVDVCMPELDGFELARMIREHPRFKDTAMIFISAIHLSELDSLRGYEMGAVDYVPVPVVPGVLQAKVRVFVDLYRKTRLLARLNDELEQRVAQRTAELEAAIAHQELLAREVDHRARNALAVIQSIVSMTAANPSANFARDIEGRIQAMARAHTLLSQSRWQGADLITLVNDELAPYRNNDRVAIEGAPLVIKASVAQSLALILHELATNAAKYGALSSPRGRLTLSWLASGDSLNIYWIERCEGLIETPRRTGFGGKVISASIKTLDGAVEYDWRSTGLHLAIRVPERHFGATSSPPAPALTLAHDNTCDTVGKPLRNRRLFVVEDEPLVAMMLQKLLSDLGAQVVGPFNSLEDAFGGLSRPCDAALLDVNVGGVAIYPLAEELSRAGVPIVFLTGYQAESIETRFRAAPVLTKPIEPADLVSTLAKLEAQVGAHVGAVSG